MSRELQELRLLSLNYTRLGLRMETVPPETVRVLLEIDDRETVELRRLMLPKTRWLPLKDSSLGEAVSEEKYSSRATQGPICCRSG